MKEINWNAFGVKFNGKETKAFESLCYLLFCREFGLTTGIFGYKNQAGIEKEPISSNGQWIGFQSKFFESKLNQQDIQDSVETAKNRNPKLNKILIYVNLEFSESSKKDGKDPKIKSAIEDFAKSKGVEIEWRVPSHIEAQLSLKDNRLLAQHFFSLEKGVLDALEELTEHSAAILKPIRSEIEFNGLQIKIERKETLARLMATLSTSPLVILSGVAGVGKTAVIKDFVGMLGSSVPAFIFKAAEFNVTHINDLFAHYGNASLLDFVNEHEDIERKFVIIDSAEKLADLESQEAFQEFLSTLLKHEWKIIFTTRYSYLDDLKFQFLEVYRLRFEPLFIENLSSGELEAFAVRYGFALPTNARLLDLLRNPFYLDEYLRAYDTSRGEITLPEFKSLLWTKQIAKSSNQVNDIHVKREECFIRLAKARAEVGGLFVEVPACDPSALKNLEADEIIERDQRTGRFFITHDIYEEWALEKFIDRTFYSSADYSQFFELLGSSLPVRRAFRNWLAEKLLTARAEVKPLIEGAFGVLQIESYWKDEIIVSVLLSDYSEIFFQMFESVLLENQQEILLRVVFLLRIACKEIDENLLKLLGVSPKGSAALKTVFVKPKGSGWNFSIEFIYKHRDKIGESGIEAILQLLEDWSSKNQIGNTTRNSGLLALHYYEQAYRSEKLRYRDLDRRKEKVAGIILSTSAEIKNELKAIFDEIIAKKEYRYQTKYYQLVKTTLSSATDSYAIARNLPDQVIALADLVWYEDPANEPDFHLRHSTMLEVESNFCISPTRTEYFPASAFQTPVFQLLRSSPKKTLDFIMSFTNRTVGCYAESKFKNEVEEVDVVISPTETVKQFVSTRLWNTYRGTQVSTYLLESIHMALEKWLLEHAKTASQVELENVCIYLLKNSQSASITAVIASVVLAHPYKLFNVARILFRTKEFFFYDTGRMVLDSGAGSRYAFGAGLNYRHKIFEDERMKTAEDAHRKGSLEQLVLNYQIFKSEDDPEEVVKERQRIIAEILDEYYTRLSEAKDETELEKTWRLYLARMDRRKMATELKETSGQTVVRLIPELAPDLKEFSDDSLKQTADAMKYASLFLWSQARFRQEADQYQQYPQYEEGPKTVIEETKQIRDKARNAGAEGLSRAFNLSIPAYTCAILMRDFSDKLSPEDKTFCKEVILEFAIRPLAAKHYYYQSIDGIEPAILSLPLVLKEFPEERETIKSLLLLLLVCRSPSEATNFAIRAILKHLWNINFEDAQSLFVGYLLLKPAYETLSDEMRQEHYRAFEFSELSDDLVLKRFLVTYETSVEDVVSNKVNFDVVRNVESLDLEILNTAFQLLPLGTTNESHERFTSKVFPVFASRVFNDREDKIDYTLKHNFLDKLAFFVLKAPSDRIAIYIKPFVDSFRVSRDTADLFARFVSAEDALNCYDEFWIVWNAFYPKIVELCKAGATRYDGQSIIHNYLFAWQYWKETAKEWHTLKDREKIFFQNVARDMGKDPSVLYSVAKVLNEVGAGFFEDGILWISNILQNNIELQKTELEVNTIYYLENLVRKYMLLKRRAIRTSAQIRSQILIILNFLIEKGSVVGYLLREDML